MIFFSTESFRKSLALLLKAKREEYASIKSDIVTLFFGKTPDAIFSSPDMVRIEREFKIIKIRMPNSGSKLSKRDGYRLIYLINSKKSIVCLFYVYPKTGSLRQINISDSDLKKYLEEFINDFSSKTLVCHDLTRELSINNKGSCMIETCEYEQISCMEGMQK